MSTRNRKETQIMKKERKKYFEALLLLLMVCIFLMACRPREKVEDEEFDLEEDFEILSI